MNWVIIILISAVTLAIGRIFSKKLLLKEHAQEFLTTNTLLCTLILFIVLFPNLNFDISWPNYLIIYVKATLVTIGSILLAKSYRHADISEVAPMQNMSPIFLVVLSFFFLGEMLSPLQLGGIALMIIGTYVLEANGHMKSVFEPFKMFKKKYIIYIVITMFLYSISAMVDKVMTQKVDPYTYLFLAIMFIAINNFIIQTYKYKGIKDIKYVFKKSGISIFVVAIMYAIADIFYIKAVALPTAMIALIIPLRRLSSIIETIFGGNMFHEHNVLRRSIAAAILVAGVVLIVI